MGLMRYVLLQISKYFVLDYVLKATFIIKKIFLWYVVGSLFLSVQQNMYAGEEMSSNFDPQNSLSVISNSSPY